MIVIVFRSRIREGADMTALEALGMRMYECASSMPGFVSYKDFASTDGEGVTIVEFESEPQLLAWRNHPEHVKAQERGRQEFFSDYHIQICQPQRAYRFTLTEGRTEVH